MVAVERRRAEAPSRLDLDVAARAATHEDKSTESMKGGLRLSKTLC
jgi:hypothetical protein